MWVFSLLVIFCGVDVGRCEFSECHDDPTYDPDEGPTSDMQFNWIGVLQYIHVKNGTPHYFRLPRVVLISRLFAISTAVDAAQVPQGYALGNVAFGDYERDEEECGVTVEMIAAGASCDAAVLLVPLADVLLHPEYKHFGAPNSVALLKLITYIRSKYMLPVCLPYKDYLISRSGRLSREKLLHVDFTNDVPRDIADEEMDLTKITLLPRELCFMYETDNSTINMMKNRVMCTTGCGFHSGAPTVIHEHTGHWSLVALAQGGSPCPDPLRVRRPPAPPQHILLFPYVPWISAAISGRAVTSFDKDDPFGFIMPRSTTYNLIENKWTGHWWMGGIRCFDRGDSSDDMFRFYHEIFIVVPSDITTFVYYLEIFTAHNTLVTCVKVGFPIQLGGPRIWGLDSSEVKVRIPIMKFKIKYRFQVEAYAVNITLSSEETSTTSSSSKSPT